MISIRSLFTSALAMMAVPAMGALTAEELVKQIGGLTDKSQALHSPASGITLINAPLISIGQGPFPEIILGLHDIAVTATDIIQVNDNTIKIIQESDANSIKVAFDNFVKNHQEFLNILIGKAALLTNMQFVGQPMVPILIQVGDVLNACATILINSIEVSGQKTQLEVVAKELSSTITLAVETYQKVASGVIVKREAKVFVA